MIDNNLYDWEIDSGWQEYSVYFFGRIYNENKVRRCIVDINNVFSPLGSYERRHAKELNKLYNKQNYTYASKYQFLFCELEKKYPSRASFNNNNVITDEAFKALSTGDVIKTLYFDGKNFVTGIDTIAKGKNIVRKYVIVKHYWSKKES